MPPSVLFIYEFGPDEDWMLGSLVRSLGSQVRGLEVQHIQGLFRTYRAGGLHPRRIVNLAWVYLRTALHLLTRRHDLVVVRTSPPGIQVWTSLLARPSGVPVVCWLMDYHPEMEARMLDRRGLGGGARLLRKLDSMAMRGFVAIICPDTAMSRIAAGRSNGAQIIEHPTWGPEDASGPTPMAHVPGGEDGPIRLVYSGNLGVAHNLAPLRRLLASLVAKGPVELHVGSSAEGNARFQELGKALGIPVVARSRRLPWNELRDLYSMSQIDLGIVLLADEAAGLVSPSKFAGYIHFGLPLLYLGPPDTNAHEVCSRFGGGFHLANNASEAEVEKLASAVSSKGPIRDCAAGARLAALHFSRLNNESLAGRIAPMLAGSPPR
jgi:hypothetical protein